jgi:small ligand-binding sensory domain FIST
MQEPIRSHSLVDFNRAGPRARSGVAAFASWQRSLDRVVSQVIQAGEPAPDLVFVFAAREYADISDDLVSEIRKQTGTRTLIGCFANGCIGNGRELERTPGLSMLALWMPGATFDPIHIDQHALQAMEHDNLRQRAGENVRAWMVLTEPYNLDVLRLIEHLDESYPGVPVVGGMTFSEKRSSQTRLFINDDVFEEGAVVLGMRGPYDLIPIVTQACEPIGETWTVTEVDRTAVLAISGRPAIDVLIETVAALPADQQRQAKRHLLVGFAADEYRDEFHRGDFLIRGVLGVDHSRAAIVVGDRPRVGQTIQFQMRDALIADIDLHQHLLEARAVLGDRKPFAALLASCSGRGAGLFGKADHDALALQSAYPAIPLGGFNSVGEIGPMGNHARLHSFAASIGLFVEEEGSRES